ncbi:hypothetical protein E1A91_D01G220600v1 [Gossypium mustelinum]|uniref:Uncharacterized protein n=1 Tax=Gossypium mustelinum TaxID=34275 RepID=A0A5D2WA99_GOSMU|nr:hypothetical protein E1A91_D01G220600v1 [Gossypium mustelinum]
MYIYIRIKIIRQMEIDRKLDEAIKDSLIQRFSRVQGIIQLGKSTV